MTDLFSVAGSVAGVDLVRGSGHTVAYFPILRFEVTAITNPFTQASSHSEKMANLNR